MESLAFVFSKGGSENTTMRLKGQRKTLRTKCNGLTHMGRFTKYTRGQRAAAL